jgi:hypothetical protein
MPACGRIIACPRGPDQNGAPDDPAGAASGGIVADEDLDAGGDSDTGDGLGADEDADAGDDGNAAESPDAGGDADAGEPPAVSEPPMQSIAFACKSPRSGNHACHSDAPPAGTAKSSQ